MAGGREAQPPQEGGEGGADRPRAERLDAVDEGGKRRKVSPLGSPHHVLNSEALIGVKPAKGDHLYTSEGG